MQPKDLGVYYSRFLERTPGVIDANVLGSLATPAEFKLTCPAGETLYLNTLRVQVRDNGGFNVAQYGTLTALANGLRVYILRASGAVEERTAQRFIKSNGDWAEYATTFDYYTFGAGDSVAICRVEFSRHVPLVLRPGDSYIIQVRDDLTGLTAHTFRMRGVRVSNNYL